MLEFLHRYRIHLGIAGFFLFSLLTLSLQNVSDFQANVIIKKAPAFDGLVPPIQKAPNWVELKSDQWKLPYDQISNTIPLPVYNPEELKMPKDSLGWKTDNDKRIRNAKIIYSTPYMGNYKLDGHEYAGSHLAIDIKVPMNTPVFAIGNGVVTKVSYQASGFGHHIVVKHENFPSYDNPDVKTIYYSSYSHLNSALVKEGDVVLKGQQIGLTGQSGIASTPHLHFQIDNDQAPWHPYWPFSYKEATEAGYNFYTAIDAGFGREKGLATTINPMLYVQKYMDANAVNTSELHSAAPETQTDVQPSNTQTTSSSSTENSSTTTQTDTSNTPISVSSAPLMGVQDSSDPSVTTSEGNSETQMNTQNEIQNTTQLSTPEVTQASKFKIEIDPTFTVGERKQFSIIALDENGKPINNYKPSQGVSVTVSWGSATLAKDFLMAEDFVQGKATNFYTATVEKPFRIKVMDSAVSAETDFIQHIIFPDLSKDDASYQAVLFLKTHGVIAGDGNGNFRPYDVLNRAEGATLIMKGSGKNKLQNWKDIKMPFTDVADEAWYRDAIGSAFSAGILAGYADYTVRPEQKVTRAEFIKMLLASFNIQPSRNLLTDVAGDVPKDEWPAPYMKYALDKNIIKADNNLLHPHDTVTRKEAAEMIYRMVVLNVTGIDSYNEHLAPPTDKVNQFFAIGR